MRVDKIRAIKKEIRIPERILLFFGVLGPLGMLIAMNLSIVSGRHKNRKWYFWAVTLISLVMHIFYGVMVSIPV